MIESKVLKERKTGWSSHSHLKWLQLLLHHDQQYIWWDAKLAIIISPYVPPAATIPPPRKKESTRTRRHCLASYSCLPLSLCSSLFLVNLLRSVSIVIIDADSELHSSETNGFTIWRRHDIKKWFLLLNNCFNLRKKTEIGLLLLFHFGCDMIL